MVVRLGAALMAEPSTTRHSTLLQRNPLYRLALMQHFIRIIHLAYLPVRYFDVTFLVHGRAIIAK